MPSLRWRRGQTTRINAINEEGFGRGAENAALRCRVVMRFSGADGEVLKESILDDLGPGKIGFLDLRPSDRKAKDAKTPVRAVVLFGCITETPAVETQPANGVDVP